METLIDRMALSHRKLDEEIRNELSHPMPDELRLRQLKKMKLAIKDRLHQHQPTLH